MNHTLDNYSCKPVTLKKYCSTKVMNDIVMKFLLKINYIHKALKSTMPFYYTDASIDMSQIFP